MFSAVPVCFNKISILNGKWALEWTLLNASQVFFLKEVVTTVLVNSQNIHFHVQLALR